MAVLTTVNADLQSSDEETRRRAVLDLATVSLDDARELLFVAMGDGSWRVRKEAVSLLLGMCPDKGTIEGIIGLLASVDNAGLRNSAVEVLEGLAGRAVPALLAHLKDDDRDVRKFVVDILGTIGDRSSIPALIDALDDPDPNVSAAAAENLARSVICALLRRCWPPSARTMSGSATLSSAPWPASANRCR
ncbi:HEAT repeat domain-containing protein [Geobacter anodireducens]